MKADSNRIRKYLDRASEVDASTNSSHAPASHGDTSTSNLNRATNDTCSPNEPKEQPIEEEADSALADILDAYLEKLETGTPADPEELIAEYPQYEEPLREYLAGLNLLNAGIMEMSDSPFRFDDEDYQRLGDYELIHEIGRGGMGVVYEARQISLDRRVALKVLPFAAMLDQRQIVRFETEARAAARLQHPHIVAVHGVGCDRGVHYYAMQYIEGSSVRELIDSSRDATAMEITPRDAAELGSQAANALQAAHSCGIVHRDIKPSNLLLDVHSDLWIADFGLARSLSDNNVTQSGDVLGTLHYMSPEQARGNSAIADPRSDIYSLGVTLYELLTQTRPFTGESTADILRQIETGHAPSVHSLNPDVPRDLENVVAKAMSVAPEDRYQSAGELEADLERFLDGRATLAKPPTAFQHLARWSSRNRSVVASFVVVLIIASIAFACSTFLLAGERTELAAEKLSTEAKLKKTEQTLEEFGIATAERLRQIPGSEQTRKALLGKLLDHYEELLSVSNNDPSMLEDRAIVCTKIANIHRGSGDLQQALDSYRNAEAHLHLLEQKASERESSSATEKLAKCYSNMSVVMLELRNIDAAQEKAHRAIELQTKLAATDRTAKRLLDLAASHANLASVEFSRGNSGLPELNQAKAFAELARQQCSAEDLPDVLASLSKIYGRLSDTLHESNTVTAVDYAELSVKCSEELLTTNGERVQNEFRQLHALNCNNLASLIVGQGDLARAVALFKTAATQLEQLEEHDQLVVTLCNLAKAETREGDSLEASNTYAKAITVQSSLLLASPGDLNHVSRLGGLHNNRALALQRLGKHDHACIAYESAVELQDRAFQLAPKHLDYYRDALSRTFFNAAKASMNAGRPHIAARLHLRRSKLWPQDAQQLFSVARNMAAAVNAMPAGQSSRVEWARRAQNVLTTAVQKDSADKLSKDTVRRLKHYLANALERSQS